MNSAKPLWLIGGGAVLLFDAAASSLARLFHLDYGYFSFGSMILYAAFGVLVSRTKTENGSRTAILLGAFMGLVDATAGWGISAVIGPGKVSHHLTPFSFGLIVLVVTINGAFFAGLGYVFESRLLYRVWPKV